MNSTLDSSYSSRTKSKHRSMASHSDALYLCYNTQLCVFLVTARHSLTLRFCVSTFRSYRGVIKLYTPARDLHIAIFACFPTLELFENSSFYWNKAFLYVYLYVIGLKMHCRVYSGLTRRFNGWGLCSMWEAIYKHNYDYYIVNYKWKTYNKFKQKKLKRKK